MANSKMVGTYVRLASLRSGTIVSSGFCTAAAMSPASKYRQGAGEKGSDKGQGKEWKASSRHSSVGAGMPANAYNPGTGMFHMLDSSISETLVSNQNGRFRSIDEADDIGSVNGSYSEYDSISNNGSCSGESEDQLQNVSGKDRKGQPPGVVGGGSDKRDKIRYKNEKKHQRQKERRAQELRDRCTGYLMSRKLEALAQQLVAMGFSPDRATMALILNEGHVEHSVAWLLEGGEGEVKEDWNADGSLKIDISEELARIADLEIRFKYLRVEIERAIVACEGDLERAAEWLRDRHPQIPHSAPEYGSHMQDRGKEQASSPVTSPYLMSTQGRGSGLFQAFNHQRREDKELHTVQNRSQGYQAILSRSPGGVDGAFPIARGGLHNGTEWQRLSSSAVDGKVTNNGLRNAAQALPSPYPPPGRHVLDSRAPPHENGASSRREQTLHLTSRDPIVAPQLPQSPITPPSNVRSASVSPSLSPSSWNGSIPGASSPSSVLFFNGTAGDMLFKGAPRGKSTGEIYSKHAEEMARVQPLQLTRPDVQGLAWGSGSTSFGTRDNPLPSASMPASTSHLRSQSLPPRFLSGWGSGLPGGPADWSMWVSSGCDYKSIDWSMGASPSNSSDAGVWGASNSFASILNLTEGGKPMLGLTGEGTSQGYPSDRGEAISSINYHPWNTSNRETSGSLGLQEKTNSDTGSASGMGVPEWTSPFAGKDLFTLPHQAVPSPSL